MRFTYYHQGSDYTQDVSVLPQGTIGSTAQYAARAARGFGVYVSRDVDNPRMWTVCDSGTNAAIGTLILREDA